MASWIAGRTRPYSSSPTILITSLTSLLVRASSTAGERAKRSADFFLSFLAERSLTKDGVVPAPVEKAVGTNYYCTSIDVCLLSTTLDEQHSWRVLQFSIAMRSSPLVLSSGHARWYVRES